MSLFLRVFMLLLAIGCVATLGVYIGSTFSRVRTDPSKFGGNAAIIAQLTDKKKTIRSYSVFYYTQYSNFFNDVIASRGHPSYENVDYNTNRKWKRMIRSIQALSCLAIFFAFFNMVLTAVYAALAALPGSGSSDSDEQEQGGDRDSESTAPTENMSEVEINPRASDLDQDKDKKEKKKEKKEKKEKKQKKSSGGAAPACDGPLGVIVCLLWLLVFLLSVGAFVLFVVLIETWAHNLLKTESFASYGFTIDDPAAPTAPEVVKRNYSVGFIMLICAMGASLVLIILSMVACCCSKSGSGSGSDEEKKDNSPDNQDDDEAADKEDDKKSSSGNEQSHEPASESPKQ